MKNLLLGCLGFVLTACVAAPPSPDPGDDIAMCTTEYAPVCADTGIRCVTTPCPSQKTFPNRCEAEKIGLVVIHAGECSEN